NQENQPRSEPQESHSSAQIVVSAEPIQIILPSTAETPSLVDLTQDQLSLLQGPIILNPPSLVSTDALLKTPIAQNLDSLIQ
ncbi:hypothetical protein HN51_043158, partial [Arachis hypogaea]